LISFIDRLDDDTDNKLKNFALDAL